MLPVLFFLLKLTIGLIVFYSAPRIINDDVCNTSLKTLTKDLNDSDIIFFFMNLLLLRSWTKIISVSYKMAHCTFHFQILSKITSTYTEVQRLQKIKEWPSPF